MSIRKLKEIVRLIKGVGVTDLREKQALRMTIVLKSLTLEELKGERGSKIVKILKSYEIN